MVFLVGGEQTGIGCLDLLLALEEREQLEGGRGVHLSIAAASEAAAAAAATRTRLEVGAASQSGPWPGARLTSVITGER